MESCLQTLPSLSCPLCIPSSSSSSARSQLRPHVPSHGSLPSVIPLKVGISPSLSIGISRSLKKSRRAVHVRALEPNHHHGSDAVPDETNKKKEDLIRDRDVAMKEDDTSKKDDAAKKDGAVNMHDLADKQGVIKMRDLVKKADVVEKADVLAMQGVVKSQDVVKKQDMVKPSLVVKVLDHIDKEGCVFGPNTAPEAWDNGYVGAHVVKRYLSDEEERWIMWYSGKPSSCEDGAQKNEVMGIAVSSNGLHWRRGDGLVETYGPSSDDVGKVLGCSPNWWALDTEFIRPSSVIIMSSLKGTVTAGVYWCYYTGGGIDSVEIPKPNNLPANQPEFEHRADSVVVRRTRPGLAMSHDGRAWLKIEGEDHSGSLFDAGTNENKWDSLFISAPHVVQHGPDDLRMYYHSFDQNSGCFSVGYARSRDGMKWIKYRKVLGGRGSCHSFDELGVKCSQVIPHPDGNGYLMIYEGVSRDGSIGFGLARSEDGLSEWERCNDGSPIFTVASKENAWDSREIHSPCLVHMGGTEWRLYYQGMDKDGRTGIGMAVCTDPELRDFKRFHGLHMC